MQINQQNIEEWCLLYIDNALTLEEKKAFEQYIATDEKSKLLLQLYQKTILPKEENLIYEDKALLYRFDSMNASLDPAFKKQLYKKETSLFHIPTWSKWSMAVAAIFILFFGINYLNDINHSVSTVPSNQALVNAPAKTKVQKASDLSNNSITANNTTSQSNAVNTIKPIKKDAENSLDKSIQQSLSLNNKNMNNELKTNTATIVDSKLMDAEEVIALKKPIEQLHNNSSMNKGAITSNASLINTSTNNTPIASYAVQQNNIEGPFNEINTDEDEHVVYIANLSVNSDKLRGITRRVNSLFRMAKLTDKEKD